MDTLFAWFRHVQRPTTDAGKSLRDAFLAGVSAFLYSLSEGNFGDITPIVTCVATFLLAQANRHNRPKPHNDGLK